MIGLGGAVVGGIVSGGLHALSLRAGFGWLLAWVALVPLLCAVGRASPRHAAVAAMAYATTLGVAEITPWLVPALGRYFALHAGVALALGAVGVALVSLAHGAVLGVALALRRRSGDGTLGVVWCAACWSAWEALRPYVPPFFPACVLGTAQARCLPALQVASVAGVGAVTALVVAVNAALADGILGGAARRRTVVPVTAAMLAIALGWGFARVAGAPSPSVDAGTVVVVDGGARRASESTLERYVAATPRLEPRPTLVVWPESAIPDDLVGDPAAWSRLRGFVDALGTTLATGGIGTALDTDGRLVRFNSVLVVRPGHGMLSYHKRLLVPFAESWPAAFGAPPASLDPVAAGRDLVVFGDGADRFGALVCFEIADAAGARELAARGARFIVNVTNDVWFAGARAPHEAWAVVRAVESGRAVVRAPNLGTAAIIDPFGRTLATARARGGPSVLVGGIPDPVITVYDRTGEVFLPACLAVVAVGLRPRRRVMARDRTAA